MAKPDINVDVKPRGIASAYINAPFDKGKEALESQGYRIISLEENAKLRMQEGEGASVSRSWNWVREGAVYVPKKGKFLTKISPIMANPTEATNCHRKGQDFYLTDEQVEQALEDSVELSVKSVPTNRFGDCDITIYAFGDLAQQYGNFLRDAGIDSMPIQTTDLQKKPLARQMWFDSLDGRSVLGGYYRDLGFDYRVRGVKVSAEGTAPQNSRPYAKQEIKRALNNAGLSGKIETLVMSGLPQ